MIHIKRLQEDGADVLALVGEIDASSSIELDLAIAKSVGKALRRSLSTAVRWSTFLPRGSECLCHTSKNLRIRRSA
jgi:hypothetical protein